MPTLTVNNNITGTSSARSAQHTVTGSSLNEIDETVDGAVTDKAITCNIDTSHLKYFRVKSNKALTLQANNGTTPDYTLTLAADVPQEWDYQSGAANPITADTTVFYATNAGSAPADNAT